MPRLLRPAVPVYDATLPGFLPVILLAFLLALCTALVGQGPAVPVLVGSGEVAPTLVTRVEHVVHERLAALTPDFAGLEPGPFAVFLHAHGAALPAALAALRHPGAPGFAILGRHQIHLVVDDMKASGASLESVVAHELVHELLDQFAGAHGPFVPRWFHEGLAQHLAGDTYLGAREEDIVWRIGIRRLPGWDELAADFPHDDEELKVAYAKSYSFVSWLVRAFGLGDVVRLAREVDEHTTMERALVAMTHRTTLELDEGWKDYLRYGSGAWWRVLFTQMFEFLLLLTVPVLFVAVRRRRARARAIGRRMEQREVMFPHEFELEQRLAPSVGDAPQLGAAPEQGPPAPADPTEGTGAPPADPR